jgi:hypothetical protein
MRGTLGVGQREMVAIRTNLIPYLIDDGLHEPAALAALALAEFRDRHGADIALFHAGYTLVPYPPHQSVGAMFGNFDTVTPCCPLATTTGGFARHSPIAVAPAGVGSSRKNRQVEHVSGVHVIARS